MDTLLRAAEQKIQQAKNRWAVTTGPATALVMSLDRVGWKAKSYDTLVTNEATEVDLRADPPRWSRP